VVSVLRALVEFYGDRPDSLPEPAAAEQAARQRSGPAVQYVGGMTDRYAFDTALAVLGWDPDRLPRGIDMPIRG